MKRILFVVLFTSQCVFAFSQRLKKADRQIVENLKSSIHFLANDKLEGRRSVPPVKKVHPNLLSVSLKLQNLHPKEIRIPGCNLLK